MWQAIFSELIGALAGFLAERAFASGSRKNPRRAAWIGLGVALLVVVGLGALGIVFLWQAEWVAGWILIGSAVLICGLLAWAAWRSRKGRGTRTGAALEKEEQDNGTEASK